MWVSCAKGVSIPHSRGPVPDLHLWSYPVQSIFSTVLSTSSYLSTLTPFLSSSVVCTRRSASESHLAPYPTPSLHLNASH